MKKQPSSDEIAAMLQEGHFANNAQTLPAADPVVPTQMLLTLDQVTPYDGNPRHERNPLYDEIKDSIRAQGGLNNPLTVTRRPGDERYMVESGGNTRLQVLNELWSETSDERFNAVHCLFRPWVSESHVLAAHLIENDTRGDLMFFDRAQGILALRDKLEHELERTLSQREFIDVLAARGYGLDQGSLSRMIYTLDVLQPTILSALRAGLGIGAVRELRRIDAAAQKVWEEQKGTTPDTWSPVFQACLAEHDRPEFSVDAVRQTLEDKIAHALGWPLQFVRLKLDSILGQDKQPPSGPLPVEPVLAAPPAIATATDTQVLPLPDDWQSKSPGGVRPPLKAVPTSKGTTDPNTHDGPADSSTDEDRLVYSTDSADTSSDNDLAMLRQSAHSAAVDLCHRYDIAECLQSMPDKGMGFLVDLPRDSVVPVDGYDTLDQLHRQWLWWFLLSLSEAAVDPDRIATVPDHVRLKDLILERRDAEALLLVGEPDWKALGYEFLSDPRVPDETVTELLTLARHCRGIRRLVNDTGGLTLWPSETSR
jgi:ParB family protein of integrating conjugative element (PFGI_1 class)